MKVAAVVTEICQDFINKKINLEDFQRKLSLVIIEDDWINIFKKFYILLIIS